MQSKSFIWAALILLTPAAWPSASQIAASSGDGQFQPAGSTLPTNPTVLVTDLTSAPVAGVPVTFAVASGGGSISGAAIQMTNASGLASVGNWTIGAAPGPNNLTATAAGLTGSPVTFLATGTGPAATIAVFSGNNQTAPVNFKTAAVPCVVVKDSGGTPVAGVAVTFAVTSGGGSATGLSMLSESNGTAFVTGWTLGSTPGVNTLTATSPGLTGSPVLFTATATTPLAVVSGPTATPGSADVGQTVTFTCGANLTGTAFNWDFGDGSTDTSGNATVTHVYSAAGTYAIIVTATNGTQTVTAPGGVAVFQPLLNTAITRKSLSAVIPTKQKDTAQIQGTVTFDAALKALHGAVAVSFGSLSQTFTLKNGRGASGASSFQFVAKARTGVLTSTSGGFRIKLSGDLLSVLNNAGLAAGASGPVTIPLRIVLLNTNFSISSSIGFSITGTSRSERGK